MSEPVSNFPLTKLPPEAEKFRVEVQTFLSERLASVPMQRRAASWMAYDADFSRDLGARGWIGLTLPPTYGGGGRSTFDRFVLMEELLSAGAPVSAHWIAERQSAPLLLRYGTEAQRRRYIPEICAGRHVFCVGMSEPNVGSDLAGTQSTARRDGDRWLLRGTKLWTTNGHRADTMIGLFRSTVDKDDRRAGLTQFLIDLSLPGISRRPIRDLSGDEGFAELFFDDVVVQSDALLGEEGQGWEQVNAELAFERSGPERLLSCNVLIDAWFAYLAERGDATANEKRLAGEFVAQIWTLRNMSLAVTTKLARGENPLFEASIVKDLGTTFEQTVPDAIADSITLRGEVDVPDDLRLALDVLLRMYPAFSLRGGTREIMRGIITRGLGLR